MVSNMFLLPNKQGFPGYYLKPVRSGDHHPSHFPIFLGVLTGDPQHLHHNRYKFKYETAIFLDGGSPILGNLHI